MKKMIIMSALSLVTVIAVSGQKIDAAKVPAVVRSAFSSKYAGVTPSWEKEDGKYEAGFKQDDKKISALFEPNGRFTEAETEIRVSELPATVLTYVKEHYKGKNIKEGAKITRADGTVNFEAEVAGKDVLFDANGKFIREAKD